MSDPFVSIIVPAYNAEKTIKKCIDSLLSIDYPHYEIIVIDDGSQDATRDILKGYGNRIILIENQHAGPSKCRNDAARRVQGDFLAFTDSDCIVDKNWLSELSGGFTDEKIAATGGSQYSPSDEGKFGKLVQEFFEVSGIFGGYIKPKGNNKLIRVAHNPSCNVMYRKQTYLAVGGFDENLWPGEDVELDYRLKKKGYKFMYNPKAIVYHYRPQTFYALARMMSRYGLTMGELTKKYGFFRKIQATPVILIILITLFLIDWRAFLIVPLFYLFLLIKTKSLFKSGFVFILFCISLMSWNFGFLKGLLRKYQGNACG